LYDPDEAARTYHTDERALVLVLDEGDPRLVDASMSIVAEELEAGSSPSAEPTTPDHVEHWLEHRNDVAALEALISRGYVVDTMEVSGPWSALPRIYRAAREALLAVDGTLAATAHQSHSYSAGGCLYFTFAGQVASDHRDVYYKTVWDAGQRAVLANGGSLSHHHGVGLNRARFMAEALGGAFDVLIATKHTLDPHGILNPGKLGLPSPWGSVEGW
jgi:alkyldihydroxyacetonephosphate synthase